MQAFGVPVGAELRSLPTVIEAGAVAAIAIAAATISADADAALRLLLLVTAIPLWTDDAAQRTASTNTQ